MFGSNLSQSAHCVLKTRRMTLQDSAGGGKVFTFAALVRTRESENRFRVIGSEASGTDED